MEQLQGQVYEWVLERALSDEEKWNIQHHEVHWTVQAQVNCNGVARGTKGLLGISAELETRGSMYSGLCGVGTCVGDK